MKFVYGGFCQLVVSNCLQCILIHRTFGVDMRLYQHLQCCAAYSNTWLNMRAGKLFLAQAKQPHPRWTALAWTGCLQLDWDIKFVGSAPMPWSWHDAGLSNKPSLPPHTPQAVLCTIGDWTELPHCTVSDDHCCPRHVPDTCQIIIGYPMEIRSMKWESRFDKYNPGLLNGRQVSCQHSVV